MITNRNWKFWMAMAFYETLIWTALVPYLLYKQWGIWPAAGVIAWWALGYWRVYLTEMWKIRKINKQYLRYMQEEADAWELEIKHQEEDGCPVLTEEEVEQMAAELNAADNARLDDDIHKWIDEDKDGEDLPDFSDN
jgi:hypothetical protein